MQAEIITVKITEEKLRQIIRQELGEHFRHAVSPHQRTMDSKRVLRAMQTDKTLQRAYQKVDKPRELLGVLEELIDASDLTREEIMQVLAKLLKHEKIPS